MKRQEFHDPTELVESLRTKVRNLQDSGERIDYLSFVPDGEPTLDINLGKEIEELQGLGIKVAVITNASLLWQNEVMDDLLKADWVSVKVDAFDKSIWKKVDRPHGFLRQKWVLRSIKDFSEMFHGKLVTETMLVKGVNDNEGDLIRIADLIAGMDVDMSYISIPTRPPAEAWVKPATEEVLAAAHQIFTDRGINAELTTGFEGTAFTSSGDVRNDLLSITAVHPMREDAVLELLEKGGNDWGVVEELKKEGKLVEIRYREKKFIMRKFDQTHS